MKTPGNYDNVIAMVFTNPYSEVTKLFSLFLLLYALTLISKAFSYHREKQFIVTRRLVADVCTTLYKDFWLNGLLIWGCLDIPPHSRKKKGGGGVIRH